MASMSIPQAIFPAKSGNPFLCGVCASSTTPTAPSVLSWNRSEKNNKRRPLTVVAAAGDVSADGTTYLIAGAAAVALLGTAFPILFSRKDL